MKLSDKIIKYRKSNGWSQEEFAEKLNVSRQTISRWENGTALPDAQNILHISKLFNITTDYLLNDDYDSDRDIPVVKTVTKETENLISKKKQTHLIVAICFIVAAICLVIGIVNRTNGIQLVMFVYALFFCIGNAVIQFVLFFMKR